MKKVATFKQSPLPFGVLPFGHGDGDTSFSVEVPESPLPFGVLPFGHYKRIRPGNSPPQRSPLPFGVLPFGHRASRRICLWRQGASPLPFGVLPFGHHPPTHPEGYGLECLHCLSAFCPSATRRNGRTSFRHTRVSIAFRRSALRPLYRLGGKHTQTMPVSIAFRRSALRPPISVGWKRTKRMIVSIAFRRSALRPQEKGRAALHYSSLSPLPFGVLPFGHHPRPTSRTTARRSSPLPFGVLPFGHVQVLPGGYSRVGVSIAFRRSALRPP